MSSIRDGSGLGTSDLCNIEALAEASLCQYDLTLAKVKVCHSAGLDLEDIYLNGLVPTAQLLGKWWSSDRIDFAEVTLGILSLQRVLYEFSPQFLQGAEQKSNGYRAVFFTTPGSQHSFGTVMLSEFFKREGWAVSTVTVDSGGDVLKELSQHWFEVAGFTVSSDRGVEELKALIHEARRTSLNSRTAFMVGGPMAVLDPGMLVALGADLVGGDARESQRLAYQYINKAEMAH